MTAAVAVLALEISFGHVRREAGHGSGGLKARRAAVDVATAVVATVDRGLVQGDARWALLVQKLEKSRCALGATPLPVWWCEDDTQRRVETTIELASIMVVRGVRRLSEMRDLLMAGSSDLFVLEEGSPA
jgi:hypothetical protein